MRTKICSHCKKLLPATTEYFYKGRSTYGLDSHCKICRSTYRRSHPPQKSEATRIKDRERSVRYKGKYTYDRGKYGLVYRQNNPQVYKERNRLGASRRRARMRGVSGNHTVADIQEIFERQNGRCFYCGVELQNYDVDHYYPVSKGGSNSKDNLVVACPTCNRKKGNKLPQDFISSLTK